MRREGLNVRVQPLAKDSFAGRKVTQVDASKGGRRFVQRMHCHSDQSLYKSLPATGSNGKGFWTNLKRDA